MTTHTDNFPAYDLVHSEFEKLLKAKTGNPETPFALTSAASHRVEEGLNAGIHAHFNYANLYDSLSFFFSRDNVGLPGISLFFKVIAQVERNDAYLIADFLTKRGQHPNIGPTANPPKDWHQGDKVSDVLGAFIQALAGAKVQYQKISDVYKIAKEENDVHAVDFLGNSIRSVSYKINQGSHYIAHLKIVEDNKLALKEFDRRIPFEIEDLAAAAGIEATIPARLAIGSVNRAQLHQTHQFDFAKDAAQSIRARAAFNQNI